ncbi:autophagy protein 16 [Lophiostoma macrostomum CBS 122681]|uniref:Autophagy protein 16 n=1 Tax=Lophiostoma macrostomum CBS 122681 TaxID=1314788 RepID=A0A6A6TKW2_9PLEO|nr:autophagy protein 16 [Lophiostoma macrostomum CBS 122681]
MSKAEVNPLAEYLSALEARDAKEKQHVRYINAYTKLADRTAALTAPPEMLAYPEDPPASGPSKSKKPATPKGKASPAPADPSSPSNLVQMRQELASTQRIRSDLESKVAQQTASLLDYKTLDTAQKQRISQLEKVKEQLERRVRDRADELKGKGKFVTDVQDEMVALNLQLNMLEQENERLRKENGDLTKRWVEKMEQEARTMNEGNEKRWSGRRK